MIVAQRVLWEKTPLVMVVIHVSLDISILSLVDLVLSAHLVNTKHLRDKQLVYHVLLVRRIQTLVNQDVPPAQKDMPSLQVDKLTVFHVSLVHLQEQQILLLVSLVQQVDFSKYPRSRTLGTMSNTTTATECVPCSQGWAPSDARDGCVMCAPGFYSSDGTSCKLCSENEVSFGGAIECERCPAGYEAFGKDECRACPPGKVSTDGISCRVCDNTYATENRTDCKPCPIYSSLSLNGTMCFCQSGFYQKGNWPNIECVQCSPGADCKGGEMALSLQYVESAPAYWRSDPDSLLFYECPVKEACPGGALAACSPGYRGVLCGSCEKGYGKVLQRCKRCPDAYAVSVVLLFITVAVVLILLIIYILRQIHESGKNRSCQ